MHTEDVGNITADDVEINLLRARWMLSVSVLSY